MFRLFTWRQVTQVCFLGGNVLNYLYMAFPHSSAGKESACNAGVLGSIPGFGRSSGEGNVYPLQYSGLENSMDCIVHGVIKSWTQLSDYQIAVKKREVKSKRETERYKHLNAEFQRIARIDKEVFLGDQCKEIEENDRMGKTRDLFKKIRDTKGTFHAMMGSTKDRNCVDLTETEDIKKR